MSPSAYLPTRSLSALLLFVVAEVYRPAGYNLFTGIQAANGFLLDGLLISQTIRWEHCAIFDLRGTPIAIQPG